MHELGIVFHIIDSLEKVAQENQLPKIHGVTMEVGEVSTVIPEYLIDCWKWAAAKKELLSECTMTVEILPAVTHCDVCGKEYPTVAHGKICPHCQSQHTWLLRGSEINIKEITVKEEEE